MGSADVWWSHVPVVGRAVRFAVLLIVLRLADFMTAVTCAAAADDDRHQQHLQQQQQHNVHLTELGRNIIKGLKLEKLPDMTKVDISNEEFHCKYLEYFRRLYVDESEFYDPDNDDVTMTASYDNNDDDHDVSAILVRGQVKHFGSDNRNYESLQLPTDDDGDVPRRTSTVTFPIYDTAARGGGSRASVIKSVVRIYADAPHVRVRVYGRVVLQHNGGAALRENPSLVADLAWPAGGGGRWMDVDVTRLLRSRKRHRGGGATAASLELLLRYSPAAAGAIRFGDETADGNDDDGRHPVLHAFLDGPAADGGAPRPADVRCPGETTRRKKREGGGRGKKRRRPAASGRVRRTDCKVDTSSGNDNGTEHGGGGNKCCREEMRVVFADIPGFDFIVEPKWFDAGLCRGRCPAKYNPATRHAFIQSLLWKQHNNNHRAGVAADGGGERRSRRKVRHGGAATATTKAPQPPPKPCCAPNKLDRLQIIHVDETDPSTLKVTTWKEMAVVECACS
ncbi:uncharacterized protein LOC114129283 [Aphis gossypii]|uniref:uncharacterized protein LOC114129283 n=1 Tax=Aphis gossypii TaxID=80765 RepID=UPI00215953C4|nr:uncharacterized protein LOC114129283 [Aphis gossypii]